MAKLRFNKNFDITRVVKRLVYTVLALYVGGTIMVVFGNVMNATESPFYSGLSLIGWTVGNYPTNAVNFTVDCAGTGETIYTTSGGSNCITATTGAGVLSVVGIIAIAGVVMEFISFR